MNKGIKFLETAFSSGVFPEIKSSFSQDGYMFKCNSGICSTCAIRNKCSDLFYDLRARVSPDNLEEFYKIHPEAKIL